MTLEEIIAALGECRTLIPGPSHPADAAAADYLVRRLQGEYAGGLLIVASAPSPVIFRHGAEPSLGDVW